MPNNPAYSARSGGNQLLIFAQTLCRLTNASAPFIRARFPERTALLEVLTAAEGVCALLPAALQEQAEADALDPADFNPGDAVVVPGQDAP